MNSIRSATIQDSSEIARLLTVLGHPTTQNTVISHWHAWRGEDNAAFVWPGDNKLLGLVTCHRTIVFQRPKPVGRITSLVVDESARGQGIGKALIDVAEQWFKDAGCGLIEVTSNLRREDAHRFYLSVGYEQTSFRFAKMVQ